MKGAGALLAAAVIGFLLGAGAYWWVASTRADALTAAYKASEKTYLAQIAARDTQIAAASHARDSLAAAADSARAIGDSAARHGATERSAGETRASSGAARVVAARMSADSFEHALPAPFVSAFKHLRTSMDSTLDDFTAAIARYRRGASDDSTAIGKYRQAAHADTLALAKAAEIHLADSLTRVDVQRRLAQADSGWQASERARRPGLFGSIEKGLAVVGLTVIADRVTCAVTGKQLLLACGK